MPQKNIMLVDDSSTMRLVIRNLINSDSNLLITGSVENGALALAELANAQPDLILLDIEMPVMDGIEFLRQARPKTKAKIIVLSSIVPAGSPKAAEARSLGADAVVSKPSGAVSFDLKAARGTELFATIYRLLGIGTSPIPV
ncbi:Protein-glutamate methylesterase/protein-glutamine glutaminase [Anaerolineae bacterium]|nr:Protein-glutamate methylesterase/protein-glutamine glutaminase [Anaerolineae bacterium]